MRVVRVIRVIRVVRVIRVIRVIRVTNDCLWWLFLDVVVPSSFTLSPISRT
jgi:hypothetical protein